MQWVQWVQEVLRVSKENKAVLAPQAHLVNLEIQGLWVQLVLVVQKDLQANLVKMVNPVDQDNLVSLDSQDLQGLEAFLVLQVFQASRVTGD